MFFNYFLTFKRKDSGEIRGNDSMTTILVNQFIVVRSHKDGE